MSHQHFCHVAGHYWECEGKALRPAETEPTVCICLPCGLPLEGYDHSGCNAPIELVACAEHIEEERQHVEEVRKEIDRHRAECRLDEKMARLKSLAEGPEKDALSKEVADWLFRRLQR
jgi:hypothetical protein